MRTREEVYSEINRSTALLEERKRQVCVGMDAREVLLLQVDIGNLITFIEFKLQELRRMEQ